MHQAPCCLVGTFLKIKPPLDAHKAGLCVWDEKEERFAELKVIWERSADVARRPPLLEGHPVEWVDATGRAWLLFGNPFPAIRCPATFESWADPATWEPIQTPKAPRDANGKQVEPHSGSIAWNPWRRRWVTVFMEKFGKHSAFGELWYAEAKLRLPWSGRQSGCLAGDDDLRFWKRTVKGLLDAHAVRVIENLRPGPCP
jgi:hypothetical protein